MENGGCDGDSVKWVVAGRCGRTSQNKLSHSRKRDTPGRLNALLAEGVGSNLPTIVRVDYGAEPAITYGSLRRLRRRDGTERIRHERSGNEGR